MDRGSTAEVIAQLETIRNDLILILGPLGALMGLVAILVYLLQPILPEIARENRRAIITTCLLVWVGTWLPLMILTIAT